MDNTDWQGVMPALMTEMHSDGSLDLDDFRTDSLSSAHLLAALGC